MTHSPFCFVAAYAVLTDPSGKILLSKRKNTGWKDGYWGLPSGHLELGETPTEWMLREMREEIGVDPVESRFLGSVFLQKDKPYACFFFIVTKWEGIPKNMEPDKCEELAWFDRDALPEHIIPQFEKLVKLDWSIAHFLEIRSNVESPSSQGNTAS